MKTEIFQNLLLRSAVLAMACDGFIDDSEIREIKNMADNEIYFMGFDIEKPFEETLEYIKSNGKNAINEFLSDLSQHDLNSKQELVLIEVLLRTIESDNKIEENEVKFLQMVKSKLNVSEETIITKFPRQMNYLIDFNNFGIHEKFIDEIDFTRD